MQKQYQQKGPEQIIDWRHTVVRNHTVRRQFYIHTCTKLQQKHMYS